MACDSPVFYQSGNELFATGTAFLHFKLLLQQKLSARTQ